jgi:hypothetical protein
MDAQKSFGRKNSRRDALLSRRLVIAFLAVAFACLSGSADAFVPGWSESWGTAKIHVSSCAQYASKAIKAVTGKEGTIQKRDKNTTVVTGFTQSVGIVAYCTASATTLCDKPAAMLSILTFSSISPGDAGAVREKVAKAFGTPALIDCN